MNFKYGNIIFLIFILTLAFVGNNVEGTSAEPEPEKSHSNSISGPSAILMTAIITNFFYCFLL